MEESCLQALHHYFSVGTEKEHTTSVRIHSAEITPSPAQHKAEQQTPAPEVSVLQIKLLLLSLLALTVFISCT
jgi:hypothetical protein